MNFSRKGFILVSVPLLVGVTIIAVVSVLLFNTDRLASEEFRRYQILETADHAMVGLYGSVRALVLYCFYNRNSSFANAYEDGKRKSAESLKLLESLIVGRDSEADARKQLDDWIRVHNRHKQFLESQKEQLSKTNYTERTADTKVAQAAMQELQRQLDGMINTELAIRNRFLNVAFGERKGFTSEMKNARLMIAWAIVLGVAAMVVVTLLISFFFSESVVKRIRVLTDNSMRMASGLPLNPPLQGEDELARLDSAFHKMSHALEGAARKERATITNAADVIASIDQKLRITAVNPAAQKVWGFAADELIGRGVVDIAIADDMESAYGLFKSLAQSDSNDAAFDMRVRHKDGSVVHTSWSVDWSRAEQSYFCVAHDITERILAESLLKESEARTRLIVESLPIGLAIINEDGNLDVINRRLEQMTGMKVSDLVGKPIQTLFKTEGTAASYQDMFYAADRSMEMQMVRGDGSEFPVEVSLSEIFFRGERRFLLLIADVTERKELENLKRDFVAMVSHDLRTPLTTLHTNFDLLSRGIGGDLNEKGRKMIEVSEQETSRLLSLINNLLDVERLESGKMEMHKEVVEISAIVSRAVSSVGYLAEKSGIKMIWEFEPIETFADAGSLVQVMVNLLANAIKFSPSGSTITITATETDHFIEVRVADQGKGISEDALPTVFDRFKQVDVSDRTEKGGSGLGLAICKALIEAHGGIIGVESRQGKGTTFWWRLPVES